MNVPVIHACDALCSALVLLEGTFLNVGFQCLADFFVDKGDKGFRLLADQNNRK